MNNLFHGKTRQEKKRIKRGLALKKINQTIKIIRQLKLERNTAPKKAFNKADYDAKKHNKNKVVKK